MTRSDGKEITADSQTPPDSPWFCGHFPEEPILPGIAQLGLVFDVIAQSGNQDLKISGVRRVRFKQIIRPNDHLRVNVIPLKGEAKSFSFRIEVQEELACSGVMTIE